MDCGRFQVKYTYSLYGRFQNIHIRYTKIKCLRSLGEISLVYNLHIEKKCGICLIFFKSNAMSFRCFVDNFDVLSAKEQLVDESLGEAFIGGPQTPHPILFASLRSVITCSCLI